MDDLNSALDANRLGALWATLDLRMAATMDDYSASSTAILLTVRYRAPITISDLAAIVGFSQPACSRAVDKLVKARLIEKTPGLGNEVGLSLTDDGGRRADQLQTRRLESLSMLLNALHPDEREAFGRMVDKLLVAPVTGRAYARSVCRYCDHEACDGLDCPIGCAAAVFETS